MHKTTVHSQGLCVCTFTSSSSHLTQSLFKNSMAQEHLFLIIWSHLLAGLRLCQCTNSSLMGPNCDTNRETEKERARQTQRETRKEKRTNGLYKSEANSRREFCFFIIIINIDCSRLSKFVFMCFHIYSSI